MKKHSITDLIIATLWSILILWLITIHIKYNPCARDTVAVKELTKKQIIVDLLAPIVTASESGGDASSINGSHYGCTQLNKDKIHVPLDYYLKQSCEWQVKYTYEVYWKKYEEHIETAIDLMILQLSPTALVNNNEIIFDARSKYYLPNAGVDMNLDGKISRNDIRQWLAKKNK